MSIAIQYIVGCSYKNILHLNYLIIFLGGGVGSILRYSLGEYTKNWIPSFPLGTLLCNSLSCVLLGVVVSLCAKGVLSDQQRLLFGTGVCGGFSTYSTFTNDTYLLFQNENWILGIGNMTLNFVFSIICLLLGHKLATL